MGPLRSTIAPDIQSLDRSTFRSTGVSLITLIAHYRNVDMNDDSMQKADLLRTEYQEASQMARLQ